MTKALDQRPQPPSGRRERVRAWWHGQAPNVRGSLWIASAVVAFSLMAMLIKLMGQRLPVVEMLFIRQVVMLAFLSPMIWRAFPDVFRTEHLGLHTFRVCASLVAMLTGFTALVHLPLADATAISFAKTLFITVLAVIVLQEVVGPRRWSATLVGFVGVIVVVQPTGEGINGYALLALVSALAVAAIMVSLRLLSRSESSLTIMAYQAVALTVLLAPATAWWWVTPTLLEWVGLVVVGLLMTWGQWCNVMGFRTGEAAAIAPMDYTRIVFATLLGLLVFQEMPTLATFLGTALIIGATLYTLKRNAAVHKLPNDDKPALDA